MTKERAEQQVSTEVIGQLSDSQKQELTTLGLTIFEVKELDPKNPDHVQEVQSIIEDCVYRGLSLQKRRWFSPTESASSIFNLGLGEREIIIKQLQQTTSSGWLLRYGTHSESFYANRVSPLEIDFKQAEDLLNELKERRNSIAKFHQDLFEESTLAPDARILKENIHLSFQTDLYGSVKDKNWLKNNRLFANLLVHLSLYQQVGLTVEPQDIALINKIWNDQDVRNKKQTEIIAKIKQVAKTLNISEKHIEFYTKLILQDIDFTLSNREISLETIQESELFAISDQTIMEENRDCEEAKKEINHTIFFISQKDLMEARHTIAKMKRLYAHIDQVTEETIDQDDDVEDDHLAQFMEDEYFPFFKTFTPLTLIFVYQKDMTIRTEEELHEYVPINIYLDALKILDASESKVTETEENIPELLESNKDRVYKVIKNRILHMLIAEEFGSDITYGEIIDKLPTKVLTEYLEKVSPSKLSGDDLQVLTKLDIQKWFNIAQAKGVTTRVDPSLNETAKLDLIFYLDSEFLKDYFKSMPIEKAQAIARKLQNVITF